MKAAIEKAVFAALDAVGLSAFKRTSMFLSARKQTPWLVDREGVTYLPERKIVLKGRAK